MCIIICWSNNGTFKAQHLFSFSIAQLNVVQLTNDLTAAALAYGYFQKNLPAGPLQPTAENSGGPGSSSDHRLSAPPISEPPRLVVFVDFGHSGIQSGNPQLNLHPIVLFYFLLSAPI